MKRAFDWLKVVVETIQGIGLLAIVGLVLASIVLRNFFGVGLVWIFEATGFLMVTMVFLGAPRNLLDDTEIKVDTFVDPMPVAIKKGIFVVQRLVILLTSIAFVYFFVLHATRFGRLSSPILKIPHTIFYGAVAIGPFFAILVTLRHLILMSVGRFDNERL